MRQIHAVFIDETFTVGSVSSSMHSALGGTLRPVFSLCSIAEAKRWTTRDLPSIPYDLY